MTDALQTLPMDEQSGAAATGTRSWLVLAWRSDQPLEPPTRHDIGAIDRVVVERGERAVVRHVEGGTRTLTIRIPDGSISSRHFTIVRAGDGRVLRDAGSRNGTWINGEQRAVYPLSSGDLIEAGRAMFVFREHSVGEDAGPELDVGLVRTSGISTISPVVSARLTVLPRLASANIPVLLHSETGTGKELVSRALHELSGRKGAFIAVNCGAIPATMVEAELFGHRRGAFSGAMEDRVGLVRAADHGTLLLDEIGDLPLACQAAFLRVLETNRVRSIGDTREVPVDVRLVAATHRDLGAMALAETFRPDLLARIAGFTMTLPPLRERKEDIGHLVGAAMQRVGRIVPFTAPAARALFRYGWPRNVRELEKCVDSATLLADGRPVELGHLPAATKDRPAATTKDGPADGLEPSERERRDELVALLCEHRGNVSAVARATGKARMQIQRWMKRYGLTER